MDVAAGSAWIVAAVQSASPRDDHAPPRRTMERNVVIVAILGVIALVLIGVMLVGLWKPWLGIVAGMAVIVLGVAVLGDDDAEDRDGEGTTVGEAAGRLVHEVAPMVLLPVGAIGLIVGAVTGARRQKAKA
jgi:hypothetical protein